MKSEDTTFIKAEELKRSQDFANEVVQTTFAGIKNQMDPNNPEHVKIVEHWERRINGAGLLTESMCRAMVHDLSTLIDNKAEAKKYEQQASSAIGEVFSTIKKDELKEEDAWKYKMLTVFAIMTPLGAFSIAGNVFNYLDPIMDIFGPMFGPDGLATGIANVSTSDGLGPLGDLAEIMEVDTAIEAILSKTPILSDILEVASAGTTNPALQMVGGEFADASTGSELLILGIATAAVLFKGPTLLDRSNEKKAVDKTTQKGVEKIKAISPDEEDRIKNQKVREQKEQVKKIAEDNKKKEAARKEQEEKEAKEKAGKENAAPNIPQQLVPSYPQAQYQNPPVPPVSQMPQETPGNSPHHVQTTGPMDFTQPAVKPQVDYKTIASEPRNDFHGNPQGGGITVGGR